MAGMNLGTSVSAATRSASKFRAGNNVITLQSVSSCSCSFESMKYCLKYYTQLCAEHFKRVTIMMPDMQLATRVGKRVEPDHKK
ncbi:Histone_H3 [Hexamita inflata]|uniref:Histone H3 n=1 Tax=Hexamita inflata TaxID=28002 RepID=A0AA86NW63_9EUKA|nr:Histone H3 [Hexamita inflata]